MVLSWTNSFSARYLVEWSSDPGSDEWFSVTNPVSVSGNQAFIIDQIDKFAARFYRLKIVERVPGAF